MWKIDFCEEGKKRTIHNLLNQVEKWDVEKTSFNHYIFSGEIIGSYIELVATYHYYDLEKIIVKNFDAGVIGYVGKKWDFEKMGSDELLELYKNLADRLVYKLTEWEVYGYDK